MDWSSASRIFWSYWFVGSLSIGYHAFDHWSYIATERLGTWLGFDQRYVSECKNNYGKKYACSERCCRWWIRNWYCDRFFWVWLKKKKGAPVEFVYPKATVLVPANVDILKNAPEPELAKEFIEFLFSPEGQKLLLVPQISRLPIRPEIYNDDLPEFYPRPYSSKELGAHVAFKVLLSKHRYNVVNSLFDVMITYCMNDLVVGAIELLTLFRQENYETTWTWIINHH